MGRTLGCYGYGNAKGKHNYCLVGWDGVAGVVGGGQGGVHPRSQYHLNRPGAYEFK